MVLGLFEHAAFDEETVTLQPGDFIIAFSDGVTEALNEAGEEYMRRAPAGLHRAPPRFGAAGSRWPTCWPT